MAGLFAWRSLLERDFSQDTNGQRGQPGQRRLEMGGLGPLAPAAFVELSGMLTGATMSTVSDCMRTVYEL